jgi:plastocyanin
MGVARPLRFVLSIACLVFLLALPFLWPSSGGSAAVAAPLQDSSREFTINIHKYALSPARIEVRQNDLVKITIETADIPHSFTIDDYRISKRVNPGQTITFEFRADQAGSFPFYCSLTIDDGCRTMQGELVVRGR